MTGNELRRIRQALDLTQARLAKRLGVHAVTLCRYEQRKEKPVPLRIGLAAKQIISEERNG